LESFKRGTIGGDWESGGRVDVVIQGSGLDCGFLGEPSRVCRCTELSGARVGYRLGQGTPLD
jgi:hypothetical protein